MERRQGAGDADGLGRVIAADGVGVGGHPFVQGAADGLVEQCDRLDVVWVKRHDRSLKQVRICASP
jgi:hypothetical protein